MKHNDKLGKTNQRRIDSLRKFIESYGATFDGQESSPTDYEEHAYIHFTYHDIECEARVNNRYHFNCYCRLDKETNFEQDGYMTLTELKNAILEMFDFIDDNIDTKLKPAHRFTDFSDHNDFTLFERSISAYVNEIIIQGNYRRNKKYFSLCISIVIDKLDTTPYSFSILINNKTINTLGSIDYKTQGATIKDIIACINDYFNTLDVQPSNPSKLIYSFSNVAILLSNYNGETIREVWNSNGEIKRLSYPSNMNSDTRLLYRIARKESRYKEYKATINNSSKYKIFNRRNTQDNNYHLIELSTNLDFLIDYDDMPYTNQNIFDVPIDDLKALSWKVVPKSHYFY